jgi:hypothetical protein
VHKKVYCAVRIADVPYLKFLAYVGLGGLSLCDQGSLSWGFG